MYNTGTSRITWKTHTVCKVWNLFYFSEKSVHNFYLFLRKHHRKKKSRTSALVIIRSNLTGLIGDYTLISLCILNHCIPEVNPTWSWCVVFIICCCIIFAGIFVEDFYIYIHQWYWLIILIFFFCLVLVSG